MPYEGMNAKTKEQEAVQALEQELLELKKQNRILTKELMMANSRLRHIEGSGMYWLSLKYYKIRDKIFPVESYRYRLIKRLINGIRAKIGENNYKEEKTGRRSQLDILRQYGKYSRAGIITTPHTLYVAKLIELELKRLHIDTFMLIGEPEVYEEIPYFIICPQFVKNFPKVYAAFQMEQTVSSRWFTNDYFLKLQNSCVIFDYALKNVEYFHKPQNRDVTSRVYYLPIDYYPNYFPSGADTEKEYDVVFYGDANSCERRRKILSRLSERFNVKICSEVFGEDVYREIRKAKVLVNIHYYEGALLETTRLYETLSLNTCIIVSEDSKDADERDRLSDYVDFVPIDDEEAMVERIAYWISNDEKRKQKIEDNRRNLENRPNEFTFFFQRFMLAYDRIDFKTFYKLAGDYVQLSTNRLCLSLPESTQRRRSFDKDNLYGFECVPGLRHQKGWVGCGLSYKLMFNKAKEWGYNELMICEDDVIFPSNFDCRLNKILKYLYQKKKWSVFSGVMADVGRVKVLDCNSIEQDTILEIDHMVSTVFNIYNKSVFKYFLEWDEANRNVQKNAIDRYLEGKELSIFVQLPFLVGHKEELDSTIWGFSNIEYSEMISNSENKLMDMAREFTATKKS